MADKVRDSVTVDNRVVLPENAAAVIYDPDDPDTPWQLLLPNWREKKKSGEQAPLGVVLLTAFFVRVQRDPEFNLDMVEWMEDQKDH